MFMGMAAIAIPVDAVAQDTEPVGTMVQAVAQVPVQPVQQPVAWRFGYLSYQEVLTAMPQYQAALTKVDALRQQYESELKRVESEFNDKYEAFLEGQKEFPRTILLKRQTELQELLQRNVEFKASGLKDLEAAEKEAVAPVRAKLNETIAVVAKRQGLSFVLNTDVDACPYIEPTQGVNITASVQEALK